MQLEFKLDTKRTLHSTQLMKLPKALENLYYLRLVSSSPTYAKDTKIWHSWVRMGFSTSVREGPPGISRSDRVRVETEPEARWVALRAESTKTDVLKSAEMLMLKLQALRTFYQGKDDAARLNIFLADRDIAQMLIRPLQSALEQSTLRPEDSKRVIQAAQESLVWLTDNDIVGIKAAVLSA